MIQLKINGEWKNAERLGVWIDNEGKGVYLESEIQDIRAFGADYSYKELMQLSHADIEQKMQQIYQNRDMQRCEQDFQERSIEKRLNMVENALDIISCDTPDGREMFNARTLTAIFDQLSDLNRRLNKLELYEQLEKLRINKLENK
jgi:hypothetical protein